MSTGLRAGGTGANASWTGLSVLGFADAVLRGVGQVMLQNSRYAGLLFVLGIAASSPMFALAAVLGTAVSTATAGWLGVDRGQLGSAPLELLEIEVRR